MKCPEGRELDAFIALEVMGWEVWQDKRDDWVVKYCDRDEYAEELIWGKTTLLHDGPPFDPYTGKKRASKEWWEQDSAYNLPLHYTTDLNYCHGAEVKFGQSEFVERTGVIDLDYLIALEEVTKLKNNTLPCPSPELLMVTATALQRCRAMWKAFQRGQET